MKRTSTQQSDDSWVAVPETSDPSFELVDFVVDVSAAQQLPEAEAGPDAAEVALPRPGFADEADRGLGDGAEECISSPAALALDALDGACDAIEKAAQAQKMHTGRSYGREASPVAEERYGKQRASWDSMQGKAGSRSRNDHAIFLSNATFHCKIYSQQTTERAWTPRRSRRKQETPAQRAVRVQRSEGFARKVHLLRANSLCE
mmetsp:Transcript_638/g.1519  ORF Transcript_638/g.1519 Transcript_638/m.1519 type:complete len:204 (-) Transcript_638:80-691(-)|eukprot:CAMPEP_0170620352 /NCGR_PEP_ID=MMETSP0224-20130122/28012_1 /TAXON_ID=285029 /ORGANISM="Togula jolla, Strain CCCM 725" /LENGTH=203 /DNA_ID=CAMNT_0010946519 /DNA_START=41 /DNA_END=652 /DNA_ORIENTATION=-